MKGPLQCEGMVIIMFITIDCGTTNMRCRLFDGKNILDETRRKAGVRNTAFDGTNEFLKTSLKSSIEELLSGTRLRKAM